MTTMFECCEFKIQKTEEGNNVIKVVLNYDNLMDFYGEKLLGENDDEMFFKRYFRTLHQITLKEYIYLIVEYNIYSDLHFDYKVNDMNIKEKDVLEEFLTDEMSVYSLREHFDCEEESIEQLCKSMLEFKRITPIVFEKLGELLIDLLNLR